MLTKSDVNLIGAILDDRLEKKGVATKKDIQRIEKKFDKLFDFLDKDYIKVKQDVREIQSTLHIPVSAF